MRTLDEISIYTTDLSDDEFKLVVDDLKKDEETDIHLTVGEYSAYLAIKAANRGLIKMMQEMEDYENGFSKDYVEDHVTKAVNADKLLTELER